MVLTIPKIIKMNGLKIRVKQVPNVSKAATKDGIKELDGYEKELHGYAYYDNATIYIKRGLCDDVKRVTFLHELAHFAIWQSNIVASENQVELLTSVLGDILESIDAG